MSATSGNGMGGFAISTAKTDGVKLSEKKFLVESTIVEGTTNNGFFDVAFFIEEKMSIFIENDAFYFKEFAISRLIKNN